MITAVPQIRVTRRYTFPAAHRLHTPLLGEEENRRVYGKCNNPYGHGHDYVLEVTIAGPHDPGRGRLLPIEALDGMVRTVLLDEWSNADLNVKVAEFASLVPTTENLALVALRRLELAWPIAFPGSPARLEKLRIRETRRNVFEAWAGDAAARESNIRDASLAGVRRERSV